MCCGSSHAWFRMRVRVRVTGCARLRERAGVGADVGVNADAGAGAGAGARVVLSDRVCASACACGGEGREPHRLTLSFARLPVSECVPPTRCTYAQVNCLTWNVARLQGSCY